MDCQFKKFMLDFDDLLPAVLCEQMMSFQLASLTVKTNS